MPDLVLDYHRLKVPIDHPNLSVTRAKLEYPTVDVSFAYLSAINRVRFVSMYTWGLAVVAGDPFADKSVVAGVQVYDGVNVLGRVQNYQNFYFNKIQPTRATSDHLLAKMSAGTVTTLASESVDLTTAAALLQVSCSGSTVKSLRYALTSPLDPLNPGTAAATLSATDTTFASGYYGVRLMKEYNPHGSASIGSTWLRAPASAVPPALAVIEVEFAKGEYPNEEYKPALLSSLVEVSRSLNVPIHLVMEHDKHEMLRRRGFTDDEIRLLLGHLPQRHIDVDAVTWGTFEFSEKSPTNIVVVTGDNPYKQGAIQRQAEYAKKKGLRVFDPPRNYGEAVALYNKLKSDFPHWLAGKDNFAYMCLGWEELDVLQNVDFYYGELLEHRTHHDQLRQVPEWEIRSRLLELKARLEKMAALHEERGKHLRKVGELLRGGW